MFPLKIISWNIEHFNGNGGYDSDNRAQRLNRVERVATYLAAQEPDVFGLSEVEGNLVYERFTEIMPGYAFSITEGRQTQEIMIGVKNDISAFFTQRNEFKRNNPFLRPGALLTVREGDIHVPILFTHLKSMPTPEGFGLRDAMFEKIFNLKKELDKKTREIAENKDAKSNLIVLGDMNTMGMDYYRTTHDIPREREIAVITSKFKSRKMTCLKKTHENTFFNGSSSSYPPSNLDHVFAANHLSFAIVDGDASNVLVDGWARLNSDAEKDAWIADFSDHAPLILTLNNV